MDKYFAFKDNVILVHGVKKGLIQDLNKEKIFSIDENSKYYLNKLLNGTSIENIVIDMSEEIGSKFIKYLELLIENELGYYSDKKIISGKYEHEKCVQRSVSTVWLELRKACNLNCCHCYMDCNINSDFHLKLLTINEWKCIIDELEEFKPKKIIFIGGEPLLFKNIID